MIIKTDIPELPAIFKTRDLPPIAKWAADKIKSYVEEKNEADVKCGAYIARSWHFEGKMPRKVKKWFDNWKSDNGNEYSIGVVVRGGHYVGERQTVYISFCEYEFV